MKNSIYRPHRFLKDTLALAESESSEQGFSIIEALVSILLISIMSAGIFASTRTSLRTTKLVEYNHIATSLATSKMEEIASKNVSFVTAADGGVETAVTWPGLNETFRRETTITVNGDDSRAVTVVVNSNSESLPTEVVFTNEFAHWE